jgi:hypothetical protein
MNRVSQWIAGAATGVVVVMGAAACHRGYVEVSNGPVAVGTYDYEYYPDSQVYFYPTERVYYWHGHDGWEHGRDLPAQVHVDRGHAVALHLKTARPYEEHDRIIHEHPGHPMAGER